jgi:hypothetical protein
MAQHPKTETWYASKNPSVTPYKLPKHFLWDTSTATKGPYRFKNKILNKSIAYKGKGPARGMNEASSGKTKKQSSRAL